MSHPSTDADLSARTALGSTVGTGGRLLVNAELDLAWLRGARSNNAAFRAGGHGDHEICLYEIVSRREFQLRDKQVPEVGSTLVRLLINIIFWH